MANFIDVARKENTEPSGNTIGLDVGLKEYYTDSNGVTVENPRFLRKGEKVLKRSQRRVNRKVKGSKNRGKARQILGKRHLKISRQRKDHAIKLARCVIRSNDSIAYEDLRIKNLVKNHCLGKSINDASWYQFRIGLEYFGKVFGRVTVAVNPQYTSQECFSCGAIVKKTLSTRTHICRCGCRLDRDENAAKNIRSSGIGYGGAHRNLCTKCKQRFGRINLYWCWRNPASASWFVEQRILVLLGRGVSTEKA